MLLSLIRQAVQLAINKIKSNLHYTRRKYAEACNEWRGPSPGYAPPQTSQRWRAVGDTVPI